nr:MAG TPA: hypothetical protein [Caudoviricetes sp.]
MYGTPYYAPYQYYYPQNADFKAQYQQTMQSPMQQAQTPLMANTQPKNDMIWVLNKNEADSYPVAPNCSVTLWDKNAPTIYLKSMSANGVPSMRILDFTERTENATKTAENDVLNLDDKYVTLDRFNALEGKFDSLQAMCEKNSHVAEEKPKTTSKKAKEIDE